MVPITAVAGEQSAEHLVHTMVHELRQPLSTIDAVAFYLKLILAREDAKARDQAAKLHELVEQANWILTSTLQLINSTPAAPQQVDLTELIGELASPSRAGEWPLELRTGSSPALVRMDPGQARRMIESLIGLFRVLASPEYPVTLTVYAPAESVSLEFSTSLPGYRSETALPAGSGLSLALVRRVLDAHGGSLEVKVDAETGIRVRAVLP